MSELSRFKPLFDICTPFRQFWHNRELIWLMAIRSIESQFNGSYLGVFWSFIHPLCMLAIYTFIFSCIFNARFGMDPRYAMKGAYAIILFSGMAMFSIFSNSVSKSSVLLESNRNLVKKVVFPLELLPVINLSSVFLLSLIHIFLVIVGAAIILKTLSWTMLLLPVTLIPLLLFTCGFSYFIAALGVFFKDLPYLLELILQIWFFMTPIIYPISIVPKKLLWVYHLNPMTQFVEQTRRFLIYDTLPDPGHCLFLFVLSCFVFQVGYFIFIKTKRGFADVL